MRRFTTVMSVVLFSSLVAAVGLPAVAELDVQPPVPQEKVIPHTVVPLAQHKMAKSQGDGPRAATGWPAAGAAEVDLPKAPIAQSARQAGSLPVKLNSAGGGPDKVSVAVADQALSRRAGVTGVAVSLGTGKPGPATVSVDYSSFRYAAGADFGSRLRLVRLPACALTTPEIAACQQQTPLRSHNNGAAQTVTAEVALEQQTVVAAVGGSSGSQGSFEASSLSPSGTWTASGNTGSFNWSYPIAVPPTAGTAPSITLSYDSGSVDGRTAATNNQPSAIGQGWDYSPGFIERTYRSCSVDESLPKPQQTNDLCWAGQIVTMSLNGSSMPLVFEKDKGWHAGSENGARIELVNDPGLGGYRGEYWKVTTTDGVSYYFGRNKGPGHTNQQQTNSAWTVPVYGPHDGNPCFNSAGFDKSSCTQAWRWNLDFVEDLHGNVTAYYYDSETGVYGPNNTTTGVDYVRGGNLRRIDYGIRKKDGSMYGQTVPGQVLFDVAERCLPSGAITCAPEQFTRENAQYWPDTPVDQNCKKDVKCDNHAPTFWSTKRMTSITTQYNTGAGPVKVDTYRLGQSFPSVGDPELRLDKITRTGYDKDGKSLDMPPVEFTSQLYANRVEGFNNMPAMPHWRLTNIWTETGSVINVGYSETECGATTVPTDQSNVTKRCFPVKWGLNLNNTEPVLDWFHKYLVTSVEVQDRNAISPPQSTSYTYVGDPAWHFDDNETVKPKDRTYGQFRGYQQVDVRTGKGPDKQTLTRTTYFRGMDNDVMPGDKHRTAKVPNSLGEEVADNDNFAGSVRETRTYDGDTLLSTDITDMKVLKTTATRARDGMNALTADIVATERSRGRTNLAAGGTRGTTTTNRYDNLGRIEAVTKSGDGVPDICTTTKYADNTDSWIRTRVSEIVTSKQVCPSVGQQQTSILAATRTYYDNQDKLGVITGRGLPTRTDSATANANDNLTFQTMGTSKYDASGRPIEATDANGATTRTAYTPVDGGILAKVANTNPLNQTTTAELEPAHGQTILVEDVGKHRTVGTYDALGRLTQVWHPGRTTDTDPNVKYSYLLRTDGPLAVTTQTLVDNGKATPQYTKSVNLYDGMGQLRQSQADDVSNPAGVTKRVAKDVFYDSHGWVTRSNTRYRTDGPPETTLISVADDAVEARLVNTYDNAGRQTKTTSLNGLKVTLESRTVYGGDRVTRIPPAGGVPTTTVTDVLGNNTSLLSYTSPPVVNGNIVSGGAPQTASYKYNAQGQLERMTDAAGNVWTYGYDFLGRQKWAADPDSGRRESTFDNVGQVVSTKDSRDQVLSYDYDTIGRRTAEYLGKKEDGKKLASWEYDTAPGGVGKLAASTRYTPQGAYIVGVASYDTVGNPAKQLIRIPAAETGLDRTYETTFSYTTTGLLRTVGKQAMGGLPAETITMDYDRYGNASATTGYNAYVSASAYTPFREASQYTLGVNNGSGWLTFDRDRQNRRVTKTNLSVKQDFAQVDELAYSYDLVGNLTKIADTQGSLQAGAKVRTQCFGYDSLARLTDAWTATDNCAAAPSSANVGGPKPYWTTWSIDQVGLRKQQFKHGIAGGADEKTDYTYPNPGENVVRPHAVRTATTGSVTNTYDYDAAGNTKTRALPGGTQTLEWNEANRLAKVTGPAGETSYVYDADGGQLVRHDPGRTTLFLGGEELSRDNRTGVVIGTRYYSHNGSVVALRVGATNPQWLQADQHGTNQVSVASNDFTKVARRELDPYGNPIGGVEGAPWPDSHGFLDKSHNEVTGLTDIGARNYDPALGRFISVDPVMDTDSPQQWAGYTYANNNPTTLSDPTGLAPCGARPCSDPMPGSNPCGARPCNDPMPGSNPCGARPCHDPVPHGCGARPCHDPMPQGCGARRCNDKSDYDHAKPKPTYPKSIPQEHTNYAQDQKVRRANLNQHLDRLRFSPNQAEFEEFRAAFCSDYPDDSVCVMQTPGESGHGALDVLGLLPVVGGVADVANAIWYFAEGDWQNGLANVAGIIPVLGDAGKSGWKIAKAACSFSGDTQVVMADGSTKPISEVETGDQVLATDPETGEQGARVVEATIVHQDTLQDLVLADGAKVTTTEDHPFWNETDRQWQRADQLDSGDDLRTATGVRATVSGLRPGTMRVGAAYNLTVDGLHTYHVLVGATAVLVHNTKGCIPWSSSSLGKAANELENGATSVTVGSRSQAEELFLGIYQGQGYRNATGSDGVGTKQLYGSKGGTYHWDDQLGPDGRVIGHGPDNPDGAMRHLQIHTTNGPVIRIFFRG